MTAVGVFALWMWLGAVSVTALTHAVVCRRRRLESNQISTIANGAFTGLTALTWLYDAGLWGFWLNLVSLLDACMDVGAFFPGLIKGQLSLVMAC